MKYYFERKSEGNISKARMYSYQSFIAGLVSAFFGVAFDEPSKLRLTAAVLTAIFMTVCMVASAADILAEKKKNGTCNVYDLLRCVVSLLLLVFSVVVMVGVHG